MKPCPFCGSVKLNITHSDSGLSAVECEQCGAAGPLDEEDAPAVERWDQRTDKAQIKSLMETPNIIPSVSGSPFAVNPELINEAKCEINRLIWQYSPPETTLGQADELSCKILNSIQAGRYLL